MKVYNGLSDFGHQASVVATGIFDGVHTGHSEIIRNLSEAARKHNAVSLLCTFWPHPRTVLTPRTELTPGADNGFLLNTPEEKIKLLNDAGLHIMVVIPFTNMLSSMDAGGFVKDILIDKLNMKALVIGNNHHLGKNREGNSHSLEQLSEKYGFELLKCGLLCKGESISSTRVRNALKCGDINLAEQLLGYPYFLSGRVVHGKRLGRELGFPTANIKPESQLKLIPAAGVYAVEAELSGHIYKGMLNIGKRPSVSNNGLQTIEVHLFDFDHSIYNETIKIIFKKRFRNEEKFDSIEILKKRLEEDKKEIQQYFT